MLMGHFGRVFLAVNSSLVGAAEGFLLEAVVDACLTAKYHGFHSILFLSDSRGFGQALQYQEGF